MLFYAYLGYPFLIFLWSKLLPSPTHEWPSEPLVSLLIVAHNERATIEEKIRNVLSLDYPRHRLKVVLASDGSTDDTVPIATRFRPHGVEVVAFNHRRGKAAVLNDVWPRLDGEIVLLADARQQIHSEALRILVRRFADPQVGAVSGELMLQPGMGGGVGGGAGIYWRYEKLIRRSEAAVHSTIGATGALYAIRRTLFEPIPDDTILDDVLIPLRVVRQGYRVLFESRARAFDRLPATSRQEFKRKVRTIAGTFQLFARERWLLNPARNRVWLQTVSHKGLRLWLPLLHAGVLIANLGLLGAGWFYGLTFAAQALFYLAALGGYLARRRPHRSRLLSAPYVLCLMSWATVLAAVRFVRGLQSAAWDPTRFTESSAEDIAGWGL